MDRMFASLLHDPLVEHYTIRMRDAMNRGLHDGLTDVRIVSPRDVVAEQRHLAARLVDRVGYFDVRTITGDVPAQSVPDLRLALARKILRAVPFLWRADIAMAAIQSRLPRHQVHFDDAPHAVMWWTYERAVHIEIVYQHSGESEPGPWIDSELVEIAGDDLFVTKFGSWPDGTPVLARAVIHSGSIYPDEVLERTVLAELAFLRSSYVESPARSSAPLNRGARKRLEHKGQDLPMVHFVQLRSDVAAARSADALRAGETSSVEWHVRWIVRGHYRNQWYPSARTHRVIWIPAYVKGPADRPLRPPRYVVSR